MSDDLKLSSDAQLLRNELLLTIVDFRGLLDGICRPSSADNQKRLCNELIEGLVRRCFSVFRKFLLNIRPRRRFPRSWSV